MNVIHWMLENWDSLMLIANGLFTTLWTIAKLTPAKWDEGLLAKLQRSLDPNKDEWPSVD